MPFRFNHKDLAVLAAQPSEQFTKEGILWFKEKEGKLFNKSESFSERVCRLRGNLLFYFKGKEKTSECSGIIVLERFKISSDNSFKKHGFVLEFEETDEQRYEFAASSKEEYDEWLALIKNASYEKLQNRILEMRSELLSLTGQDPLLSHHMTVLDNNSSNTSKENEKRISLFSPSLEDFDEDDIMMEMCIACTNLVSEYESLPSAMVKVSTVIPPDTEWTKHSQTEICEETQDPNFLRTFVFTSNFPSVTRLKFVVYDVLSKSKNDTALIGQSVCTIQEIQQAPNWQISLSVMNMESSAGVLIIQGWRRESGGRERTQKSGFVGPEGKDGTMSEPPRPYVANVVQRSFHFPTRDGNDLKFQEFLAESTLCFKIPKRMLNLFIAEEKEGVVELHNIGQLHPEWERIKQVVQNSHFDLVHQYSTNLADLCQYEGDNFKRSVDKAKKELEFIPTNLHLQRLCVIEADNKEHIYDVVTVGAPTAHSLKFRHGGLKRLIASSEDSTRKALQSYGEEEKRKTGFIKACHVKDVVKRLKEELTSVLSNLKEAIESCSLELLSDISTLLSNKIGEFLGLYATTFVCDSEQELLKARTSGPELRIKSTIIYSDIDDEKYKNFNWKWTGTDFKATSSQDIQSDAGVFDANAEFLSAVNYICKTETFSRKEELLKLLRKLEECIFSLVRKVNVVMQFVLMQEEADCPGLKDLRYRRDIVLSQALTPVVCGFALMLSQRVYDHDFFDQIANIGLLVHFESLLATYGDEMGMIEDMYTGLLDLRQVKFKIVVSDSDILPTLKGNRSNIIVEFPMKAKLFNQLPLKLQQRQIIHLHPVLFSVGINEQATLAETFGDTSLQEVINVENLSFLQIYFDAFINFSPHHVGSRSKDAIPLSDLMEQFKSTVNAKKSKNYDILLISEELCARMNGLRLTSCKSAKDRSSMAVTLETVHTLEREHGMKEDVAQRVLNSIRSQGTRLINSYKNVGLPKYAFNKVQVKALPSVYRPPEGTIGKNLQT